MSRAAKPQVAVVTGASKGIGRAVALELARRGVAVALWSRSKTSLRPVSAELKKLGVPFLALGCDVSRSTDVAAAAKATLRAFGAPHIVVNNAGIVHRSLVEDTSEKSWDQVVGVNLKATFLVTRALLPAMKKAKAGRFVNVASISSTLGTARQASYCAAKWGVVGFTKSLAEELRGSPLVALSVLPGSVNTDMLKGSGFAPAMEPEDVARLVVYAAIDAPAAMNGSAVEMFG